MNTEKEEAVFKKIDETKEELTDQDIDILCDWVEAEWKKLDGSVSKE